jgi:hypothetical protein
MLHIHEVIVILTTSLITTINSNTISNVVDSLVLMEVPVAALIPIDA